MAPALGKKPSAFLKGRRLFYRYVHRQKMSKAGLFAQAGPPQVRRKIILNRVKKTQKQQLSINI